MVLGLVGGLVLEYTRISRFDSGKQGRIGAQIALERVRSELTQAVSILPASTDMNPSSTLRLERVNPNAARLPVPLPDPVPLPGTFQPLAPSSLMQVVYQVAQGRLLRSCQGQDEVLATGIAGFSVRNLPNGNLRVDLTQNDNDRLVAWTTEVYLPARRTP